MPSSSSSPLPPLTMSRDEYQELQSQVSELSVDDATFELLECCQLGDVDVVRALCEQFPELIVNTTDSTTTTTTPLHKASANGHVAVVQILLHFGATACCKNQSGNTPLHWAAANAHVRVVELLLQQPNIDVLEKNAFGRSALTEGFGSSSTETAKLLLEHESATEERLLSGGTEVNVPDDDEHDDDDDANNKKKKKQQQSIIHELQFGSNNDNDDKSSIIKIRELPILTNDPFGQAPIDDTTGYAIWCASLVMARWMADIELKNNANHVVELGAGCGVPGLSLAKHHSKRLSSLLLTDLNPTTVDNLQYNIGLNHGDDNGESNNIQASTIDWDDETTWPTSTTDINVVIGSDLIYHDSIVPLLIKVVTGLLSSSSNNNNNGNGNGTFYYAAPHTGRDGLERFLDELPMKLISKTKAPASYLQNPLASQDDEEFFLHFHEMTQASSFEYYLYVFEME